MITTILFDIYPIKQISYDIIAFARNMIADDEKKRNNIKMRVLKCRHTGLTGNVKGAQYILETGRLVAADEDPQDDFETIPIGD